MNAEEEWLREARMVEAVASRLVGDLTSYGRIRLTEELFLDVYPEIRSKLRRERGWWNPLVNPYTTFHFYSQAVMIASPVSSEDEFMRLYNIAFRDLVRLVEEELVIVLLSAPHTHYTCSCFDRLLEAQGALPTVLRLTETMKALLVHLQGDGPWSTKFVYNALPESIDDDMRRDLATRISDLATIGYRNLAENILNTIVDDPVLESFSLARSLHHILVEPIIDSGATIGVFSIQEVDFIEKLLASSKLSREHVFLLGSLLWSMRSQAKLVVPRRTTSEGLLRTAWSEKLSHIHRMVADYRKILVEVDKDPDAVKEAGEIARVAARAVEQANRELHMSGSVVRKAARLGFVSQIPVAAILAHMGSLTENALIEAVLSSIIGSAAAGIVSKILESLLTVEENIYVLPVTPLIYEKGVGG